MTQKIVTSSWEGYVPYKRYEDIDTSLTRGERVLMEGLALAVPVGWTFRGLRALHHSIKGAKVINTVRRGKQITLYRKLPGYKGRGGYISRINYRNRLGLTDHVRAPDRAARILWKKSVKEPLGRLSRTPLGRVYSKVQRTRAFFEGPGAYAFERFAPPWLRYGAAAYGGYRYLESLGSKQISGTPTVDTGDESITSWFYPGATQRQAERIRLVELRDRPFVRRLDRSGEVLPPILKTKSVKSSPHSRIKPRKRCPSGHRWSSRLRKCVRVNGRRA